MTERLNTVFLNGTMTRTYTLAEVRKQAEVMYRCGCPYDADHPDPSRCHQHGAPLEPRVFGEGWVVVGLPDRDSEWYCYKTYDDARDDWPTREIKRVRLIEVVEP